jgi:uncharacterized repeat protein (TIGR02543 family)
MPVQPARAGYEFVGWFYERETCQPTGVPDDSATAEDESQSCVAELTEWDFATVVDSDLALTAEWREKPAPILIGAPNTGVAQSLF